MAKRAHASPTLTADSGAGENDQPSGVRAARLSLGDDMEASDLSAMAVADFARGRFASAADAYEKLDKLFEPRPVSERVLVKLRLATALYGAGHWSEADKIFEVAAALRPKGDRRLECEELLAWSRVHETTGNLLGARALAHDAFARAAAAGLHALAADAAYRAARLHGDPHPSDEVLSWVTRGLAMLALEPDRHLDLLLRVRRAVTQGALTTPGVALSELKEMLDQATDLPEVRATILGYLADQHERRDELDEAEHDLKEALALAKAIGLLRHEGRLSVHAAVVANERKKDTEARLFFTRAIEVALDPCALNVPLLLEVASIAVALPSLTGSGASCALLARVARGHADLQPFLATPFSFQARRCRKLRDLVDAVRMALRGLQTRGLQFATCIVHFENCRLYVPKGGGWVNAGKELPKPGVRALVALDLLGAPATAEQISRAGGGSTSGSIESAFRRLQCEIKRREIAVGDVMKRAGAVWTLAPHRALDADSLEKLIRHGTSRGRGEPPAQLSLGDWGGTASSNAPKNSSR